MAIQSERNLYPGINPHLNSFLQQPDGAWEAFHAHHTVELASLIDATLPEAYYALAEKSLQISSYIGEDELPVRSSRTTPDATIYKDAPANVTQSGLHAATPTMIFPITETFVE